jgi:DNA end-binding protein Ku
MSARAIASGTISFGLVAIPVKIYSSARSEKVSFNMLERGTGSRLRQQYVSVSSGAVVERKDIVRAYEHQRGHYVVLEDDELKALESAATGELQIEAFADSGDVDLVHIEKSYYLGPDKGSAKAYKLLGEAMRRQGRVAIGRWKARGKEQLVMVRPYKGGLILHQLYYASEVRRFEEVDGGLDVAIGEAELALADRLIEQLSIDRFDAGKYVDTYSERVRARILQKLAGSEIAAQPEAPKAQIIDLFEALKQSLGPGPELKKAEPKKGRKRARQSATPQR